MTDQTPPGGNGRPVNLTACDQSFAATVRKHAGTNFSACLHCKSCSGGCPFSEAMQHKPNGVIRLVQLGLRREALENDTMWICVGCHTCSVQCPMNIDIAAVMDALRHMALATNAELPQPDILTFHQAVLASIQTYGRTHKLDIMMRYKLKARDFFSDMNVGLRMLAKRKLDLTPSRVRQVEEVRALFDATVED